MSAATRPAPRRVAGRIARGRAALAALALALAASLALAHADDGADAAAGADRADVDVPPDGSPLEDGGFLEIGAGIALGRSSRARLDPSENGDIEGGVNVVVSGAWRRGRLFLEGRHGGLDGISLGATLWHDERHVLDLLGVHVPGTLGISRDDQRARTDEAARDLALIERDSILVTSGFRLRRYDGPRLLQLSAVVDWAHGNGVLVGAHAGHQWQFGNWSVEGIAGFRHAGADVVDFVYGVDADEATTRFDAYRAPAGGFVEADLAVSRPLGRHWVFRSSARARRFDDGVSDSPLLVEREAVTVETGLYYVF